MTDLLQLLQLATDYEKGCLQGLNKEARKSKSEEEPASEEPKDKSIERLKKIKDYKDDSDADVIDLTGASDFSYSAIMREMRQNASDEQVRLFLTLFKKEFDKAVKTKLQKPEKVALQNSLVRFDKKYKVKCKKKLVKNAAVSELGDPVMVGKYLADIVKFMVARIPLEKRQSAIDSLRKKFYTFNANEISEKDLPPTSGIGQSITFVKHVLFNQNPFYIREVLNNIVSNL